MLTIMSTGTPSTLSPQALHGLSTSLRIGVMRLGRRLRQEGQRDGLTPTQLATLATLDKSGPLSLGELAAAERVQPPSMTRVIVALEAAGLVARSADPTDGRVALVSATRAGRAALGAIRRRRDAWLELRLAALPPQDIEILRQAAEVLERLADA